MSNVAIVWNEDQASGDWQVTGGRIATGHVLRTAVLISLFTDRVAQPGYVPNDNNRDRRGWWMDTFTGVPIGSRLWQLRRRKIANRQALINEATDICAEATQWMIDTGLVQSARTLVTSAPTGVGGSNGSFLAFATRLVEPTGGAPLVRSLWSSV